MQVNDSRPIADAFEKKYASREPVARERREGCAARADRDSRRGFEVDVIETDARKMRSCTRRALGTVRTPAIKDIPPGSSRPTAPTCRPACRSTARLHHQPRSRRRSSAELRGPAPPEWAGRFAVEAAAVAWFRATARAMGEAQGSPTPQARADEAGVRSATADGGAGRGRRDRRRARRPRAGVARLKEKGAPIEWKRCSPPSASRARSGWRSRRRTPTRAALRRLHPVARGQGSSVAQPRAVEHRGCKPAQQFQVPADHPRSCSRTGQWSRLWSEIFLGGNRSRATTRP